MSSAFFLALVLIGASCLYLYTVAWSFRASSKRDFSTPWLLVPLSGAAIAGTALVFGVPVSPAPLLSLRLLELLAHLCNILLLWAVAGKIAPRYRLAGAWLYAWNPLVLVELAVYADTAGVVICLLLLSVVLLLTDATHSSLIKIVQAFRRGGCGVDEERGRLRRPPISVIGTIRGHGKKAGDASVPTQPDPTPAPTVNAGREKDPGATGNRGREAGLHIGEVVALILVGLAVRINFMALLVAPLLLWLMASRRRGAGAALVGFTWRAMVVLAVLVLAYLPGWRGSATFLAITNGFHLFDFANSPLSIIVAPVRSLFSFVAQRAHFPPLMQPDSAADMAVLATSFFLFALLYVRELGRVGRHVLRLSLININDQNRECHSERSEESFVGKTRILSEAKNDRTLPFIVLNVHQGGRSDAVDALFTGLAIVILGYIVLAATVFSPAYLVWGVWVVALRRFDGLSVCMLLLSCSALLYYALQRFAPALPGFLLPLCVFGIPLVYLVVQSWIPAGRIERKDVLT